MVVLLKGNRSPSPFWEQRWQSRVQESRKKCQERCAATIGCEAITHDGSNCVLCTGGDNIHLWQSIPDWREEPFPDAPWNALEYPTVYVRTTGPVVAPFIVSSPFWLELCPAHSPWVYTPFLSTCAFAACFTPQVTLTTANTCLVVDVRFEVTPSASDTAIIKVPSLEPGIAVDCPSTCQVDGVDFAVAFRHDITRMSVQILTSLGHHQQGWTVSGWCKCTVQSGASSHRIHSCYIPTCTPI